MERILKLPLYSALGLLVYMPFHVFLSQWLSTYTGGLDLWKIAKDLFLVLAVTFTLGAVAGVRGFRDRLFWLFVIGAIFYLVIHFLTWYSNQHIDDPAALLATAYNTRLLAYGILGWGAILVYPGTISIRFIFKVAIAVSTIVALLGVIQFVLPKDLMTHFGYSLERGVKPAFFIDDKGDLPRIMSTIRDPNSLGAYLILPITALSAALFRVRKGKLLIGGLLLLHSLALFLTFSRSALIGTILAVIIVLAWVNREKVVNFAQKYGAFLAVGLVVLTFGAFLLRDQYFVQNIIFHADESTHLRDSNELRLDFARVAARGITEQPLGHGPGTAGLVSIQTKNVVLTENYFLQIGYEVGLQGLLTLIALGLLMFWLLYKRNDIYGQVLLAAIVGITFCCFLLHTWSNEAIAAQWWLLAGAAVAIRPKRKASRPPKKLVQL